MHPDLNLLIALDALLEERGVGAAADRLGLSQPAMSRTLSRIRRATGDQILVRAGRDMLPTPYAESVRDQVHTLVEEAQAVLRPPRALELAALDRTFTLRCHDALTDSAGPALLAAVREDAPAVRLRFLAESAADTEDLRLGRVDLELSASEPRQQDLRSEVVGSGTLVAVVRADHPAVALTPTSYASADHVTVSRRGRLRDPVDDALEALGLARRVVASAPTTAAALRMVAAGDLMSAVPMVLADAGLAAAGLRTLPLPLDLPPVPLVMSWHHRYEGDPAHAWLRARVREALAGAGVPVPAAD
ncbi:LysR family transcriptional regulator [Streptomyces silvisoli]|uniref:LysR family transcriptional regulator n=1 Tax=Streptomyces silvisoli TaxID=3034235 RepID=A0ABT5ZDI5_9ACTN|nr:LysR family transcriptional regulator [Streptomyces silvisoli]MDF3287887.1 LysR family transcriptional regulator [Streptomyces silvisoli]